MKKEERITQTEQEERIAQMELLMERASEAVMQLSAALDIMEEAQPGIAALDELIVTMLLACFLPTSSAACSQRMASGISSATIVS